MELSYEKAVFWYYSDIVKKKKEKYSRCIVPEIYYHSVAMTVYFSSFFRRGEGLIGIFLFFFCCWFAIWQYSISPLFYIRLSYVAIKDDFCNSAPLFAFLWCVFLILFCFLVFCPQEEILYSASARLYSPMLLFFIVPLPLSSCPFPLALAFLANIWCY